MELLTWTDQMIYESNCRKLIDDRWAAYLLDLPKEQLREISEMSGFGHMEEGTTSLRWVFSFEDLSRLCRLLDGPVS